MPKNGFVKILKVVAIVFFGLTATMNLLGGVGTVCAAFLTENFPSMSAILPYRGLYQIVMILTVLAGISGVWLTFRLIQGGQQAYRNAIILLGLGTILAGTQVVASLILRGKAVPANMKLYSNAITLVIFIVLGLPGLRQRIPFQDSSTRASRDMAGGLAAVVCGLLVLSTSLWVGASHVSAQANWVNALREPMFACGASLLITGGLLLVRRVTVGSPVAWTGRALTE